MTFFTNVVSGKRSSFSQNRKRKELEMLKDAHVPLKKETESLAMALGDIRSVINEELITELLPQLRLAVSDSNAGMDGAESRAVALLARLKLTLSRIGSLPTEPAGQILATIAKGAAADTKGKRSIAVVVKEIKVLKKENKCLKKAIESNKQEMGYLASVVKELKHLLAQLHGVYDNVMNICAMVIAVLSKPANN